MGCGKVRRGRFERGRGLLLVAAWAGLAGQGCSAWGQNAGGPGTTELAQSAEERLPTYFEFGTVMSVRSGSVQVHTFDPATHKVLEHSFLLTSETRADVVHVGDVVEVIYVATGTQRLARRLLAVGGAVPRYGQPPATVERAAGSGAGSGSGGSGAGSARGVTLEAGSKTSARVGAVPKAAAVGRAAGSASASAAAPVSLGSAAVAKVPGVIAVPLGSPAEAKTRAAVAAKPVVVDTPGEGCQRGNAQWATAPVSIAVLDFRYPTEREEAHDVGTTGGGSGTAVADLVLERLQAGGEFAYSRGDRDKLYTADFAGAARVGRQLGVDAVLAGTFAPVPQKLDADGFAIGPKLYELSAGLVDTCTGQLLMRLSSVSCPGGAQPLGGTADAACARYSVTAKQAADPKDDAGGFRPALDALLGPLLRAGTTHAGGVQTDGANRAVVSAAAGETVSLRLAAGIRVQPGDQITVHATRLVKNVSTDTLRRLQDEEIGRVSVTRVSGGVAEGTFAGEYAAKAGDTGELLVP